MNNVVLGAGRFVHRILVQLRQSNEHGLKTCKYYETAYTLYFFLGLFSKAMSNNSDFFKVESNSMS